MNGDVIWKAALLTAIVFIAGIGLGVWMDNQRVSQTRQQLEDIDFQWNDARLTSLYYQTSAGRDESFCESALKANLEFREQTYQEGLTIERFESVNRFAPDLLKEKRNYALLLLQFWLNGISLRESCGFNYSTVVYFYSHYDTSLENIQKAQSIVLEDVIHGCENRPMVIAVPIDMNISTVDVLVNQFGIHEAPSLLVNEKTVLTGLQRVSDIKSAIGC